HLRILMAAPDGNVTGVVHVRDTLVHDAHHPVRGLARRPFVLAPQTPVYEALTRMRERGEHLTVVARPDRTVGVVSVADIMHRVLPGDAAGGQRAVTRA